MRGIKLCALLAVIAIMAGSAFASEVPANPFSGFGLFTEYVTSGSVRLNVGGMPDYSGVNGFVADGVKLRGKLKPGADKSSLPYGTLTIISGDNINARYSLIPGGSSSSTSYVDYYTGGSYTRGVMWNLYTSPDVIVGSAVIKAASDIDPVSIGRNDIVPFVRYTRINDASNTAKVDVCFVKSGDWGVPVAVDYDSVSVNGEEIPDFRNTYPVRHSFTSYISSYGRSVSVSYIKGASSYTWNFSLPSSYIDWGKLSLDLQPLAVGEGGTETITVKIPSLYYLSDDFASADVVSRILTVSNASVAEVGDITFTQGKGWNGGTEDKSTLTFTVKATGYGRAALRIYLPGLEETYYRGIGVFDASRDMHITEGTTNLRPVITHHTSARYIDGKPDYSSATDSALTLEALEGFTGASEAVRKWTDASGDVHEEKYYTGPDGFFGKFRRGEYEMHPLVLDSEKGDRYYIRPNGVRFTISRATNHYYAADNPGLVSFTSISDMSSTQVFFDFPDSPDMNLSSAMIGSLVSLDKVRMTAVQLEDFAPYFEIHGESLDWSFVKPSTMEAVSPSGVTDMTINGESVTGTGGTISLRSSSESYVYFMYRYMGVVYEWDFSGSSYSGGMTGTALKAKFTVSAGSIPVAEGRPYYSDGGIDFPDYVRVTLESSRPVKWSEYYNNRSSLYGTIHVSDDMSGDAEITLSPELSDTYYEDGTEYGTLTYKASSQYFTPGKTVRWVFASDYVENGSAVIPAIDTSITGRLSADLKLNRDGLNAETLEWSVNTSGDNSGLNMYVGNDTGSVISSDARSGTVSLNLPESVIDGINFSIERGDVTYMWDYDPVDRPSYYSEEQTFTWNTDNPNLPLSLKKGETREVTLTVSDDFGNIKPLVGNPDIVSMTVIASTDSTATVRLTALEAGMTTLGMTYQRKYVETVDPDGGDVVASALPGMRSSVALDESDAIDVVLNSDGTATAGGSAVPSYDYVWHADPQHPAEYWTLGMDGTDELDSKAYEAAITDTNSGLYIARDVRYISNTLDFSESNMARKDEDTEYVVYYDSSSPAVAAAIAKLGETYGSAYSTDKYIFATLPMETGGGGTPGGDTRPDFPGADSGDTRPDFPGADSGDTRPTPPSSDDDTRMPVFKGADTGSIAAMSTMTHSASDAYNNPVLHITEPGTYRISGTWHGQIWVEAGAKAKHKVNIILNGVEVNCDVAPALVFYKVYKWAEDNGYDDQSTLTANDLWKTLGNEMMGSDGSYNVGALVKIADGTTNTFTGSNVYRLLELCPKLDDDDNPKYTGLEVNIGSDISQQQKMYKLDGAFHSRRTMVIGGGTEGTGKLTITSTTCEGLDTEMHMLIDGGNITVSAPDDAINVNEDNVSVFAMEGGTLNVSSTNEDGIDSNGWIAVNGGTLNITAGTTRIGSNGVAGMDAENADPYISDSATYNWTAAGSGSPTNPDIPTPTSPDVPTPTSPDVPTPTSPDVPGPTPETRVTYYGNYVAWPREIWVSELDSSTGKYRVPHLTDDVDTLIDAMKSGLQAGGSTSWTDYDTSGGGTTTPEYDESAKNVGYPGLSVYPRFAVPRDPSADAYKAALDFVDGLNLPYGVDMFSDNNMAVIASRDAVAVWSAMKDELLSADIPQLVAIVLPEMYVREPGFYVFSLPADNITGSNQAVFWNAGLSGDIGYPSYYITSKDLDRQVFIDDSGNVTGAVDGEDYISVAAYLGEGVYLPVITAEATSNDLAILSGSTPKSPDVPTPTSPDVPTPTSPDVPTPTSPDVPTPTSPDVPTPTSPDTPVVPESAEPTKTSVDPEAVADTLRNILNREDAQILELPASSSGSSRTVADIPSSQLTAITAQGREVATVLPEITVETAAIYLFGVSLDSLAPGAAIFLDMTTRVTGAEAVNAASDYAGDYTFLDDDGNEVYTVPANRHVNLAAYLEPGYTYSPVITTSSGGGENVTGVGSSSGGCAAGFGIMAVILLSGLAFIIRKK